MRDRVLVGAVLVGPPVWGLLAPHVADARHAAWDALVAIALVYPVLEELSFRGWLQGWLLERLRGRWVGPVSFANVVTSLVFGISHLVAQPAAWAAGVVIPSLVLGHVREARGTVALPMVLHVYWNAGLLLVARWW